MGDRCETSGFIAIIDGHDECNDVMTANDDIAAAKCGEGECEKWARDILRERK